jgi:hypothetical protein
MATSPPGAQQIMREKQMRLVGTMCVLAILGVSDASARCDGGSATLFSCLTPKGKQIELCDAGKTIQYSFGKPQAKPEIVVTVPRNQASTSQWAGVGRYMTYSVDVPNGDTIYSVFWSADKIERGIEAGVNVLVKGKVAATVNCTEKSIDSNLEGAKLRPSE